MAAEAPWFLGSYKKPDPALRMELLQQNFEVTEGANESSESRWLALLMLRKFGSVVQTTFTCALCLQNTQLFSRLVLDQNTLILSKYSLNLKLYNSATI